MPGDVPKNQLDQLVNNIPIGVYRFRTTQHGEMVFEIPAPDGPGMPEKRQPSHLSETRQSTRFLPLPQAFELGFFLAPRAPPALLLFLL